MVLGRTASKQPVLPCTAWGCVAGLLVVHIHSQLALLGHLGETESLSPSMVLGRTASKQPVLPCTAWGCVAGLLVVHIHSQQSVLPCTAWGCVAGLLVVQVQRPSSDALVRDGCWVSFTCCYSETEAAASTRFRPVTVY